MKHLIILSDFHINSTVGLCSDVVSLDDGGEYHRSKSQTWLTRCFADFYMEVYKLHGEKILIYVQESPHTHQPDQREPQYHE